MPTPKLISRDAMLDLFGFDLARMSENARTEASKRIRKANGIPAISVAGCRGYRYRLTDVERAITTKTIAA
jgi:hypothetical protein